MEYLPKPGSRKKFILWTTAILSSMTVLKFLKPMHEENPDTVRMLTEDGKLVEIDKKLLTSVSKKITDKELQEWVKK